MKSQIEINEAIKKFEAINNIYESIELSNSAAINWLKKLNNLKTELCETKHWNMLIEQINYVSSLRTV